MKQPAKTRPRLSALFLHLQEQPVLRQAVFCLLLLLCCLCLTAVSVGGQALPLAACVMPCVLFFPEAIFAAIGCAAGYFLCWGLAGGLEQIAVTVLIFVSCGIFRNTDLTENEWFFPFLCCGLSAVIGLVFLIEAGFSLLSVTLYLTKLLLCLGCPMAYRKLLAHGWQITLPSRPGRELSCPDTTQQLRRVSRVFALLHSELSDLPPVTCQSEISGIYDYAAEQVCRMCVNNQTCWEQEAEQTYRQLCQAASPVMQRGAAVREDFPQEFVGRCKHMEGFITAVNQELDASRYKRQLRNRLQEGRHILANQYLFLSRFLGRIADSVGKPSQGQAQFVPEFAVSSACRPGGSVSGDRGASFQDQWCHFYVLLCDGMGSGKPACEESGKAVRTLTGLLESGVAPDTAMEILNGFYVLQENSVFSTVDLLQVNLQSGNAVLFKWGAAPSYLKVGDGVRKIGTASPPPGLSVASEYTAEQFKLSLSNGETLVLVSDGAFGEETEQRVSGFRGSTSRELAQYLIAGTAPDAQDDITAAVVRLRPSFPA